MCWDLLRRDDITLLDVEQPGLAAYLYSLRKALINQYIVIKHQNIWHNIYKLCIFLGDTDAPPNPHV